MKTGLVETQQSDLLEHFDVITDMKSQFRRAERDELDLDEEAVWQSWQLYICSIIKFMNHEVSSWNQAH
jgi:hypothetical protein